MADTKAQKLEREYVVPLRRVWLRYPAYKRGGKAIKALKEFIAKHMKVEGRDTDKVKIDIYLNNEMLFRGRKNPPAKIKVKAIKEEGIVKVELAETPKHVGFLKLKHLKVHKAAEKKVVEENKELKEERAPEKTEEEKKEEKEKENAVAEAGTKEATAKAKAEKHVTKAGKTQRPQRMALQK